MSVEPAVLFRSIEQLLNQGTLPAWTSERSWSGSPATATGVRSACLSPLTVHGSGRLPPVLREPQDVEDAFQSTFLVLIRRAGSIRDRAG